MLPNIGVNGASLQNNNLSVGITPGGTIGGQVGGGVNAGNVSGVGTIGANASAGVGANLDSGQVGPNISGGVGIQGKDVGVSLNGGAGLNGVSVAPRIRIGSSPGAQKGSSYGGTAGEVAGSLVGGPVGGAIGSTIGSIGGSIIGGLTGGKSQASKETDARKSAIKQFESVGGLDNGNLVNPDGSVFNMHDQVTGEGSRPFTNPNLRSSTQQDRTTLNPYDIDYTNDMDYVSGMAGTTFARLIGGGANKTTDQLGGAYGNAFLGKVGTGNQLTKDNFDTAMTNARAQYSKNGIKSKEDMQALANQLYAQGRITDFDHGVMNQTASMMFDNNYNLAQTLMGGRGKGINTAGQTPGGPISSSSSQPRKSNSPFLSLEEVNASLAPLLAQYQQAANIRQAAMGNNGTLNGISNGLQAVGASIAGLTAINKLTGGSITDLINAGKSTVKDWIGVDAHATDHNGDPIDTTLPGYSTDTSSPAPVDSGSDSGSFDLGGGSLFG